MPDYLHNHKQFKELLRTVEHEKKIDSSLVEKDYWIMHVLHGLQHQGFEFELKGGTSLSKGYGIIHRFSEDLDIRIEPPEDRDVKTGRNHIKPAHCESRKQYYDWLAQNIKIDGISKVDRALEFDNETYFSGGIRLYYQSSFPVVEGLKEGVLLEVGFDDVTPNSPVTLSSWALDFALKKGVEVSENKALAVKCYHPGYTLVEKLQTIATKFRKFQETKNMPANFLRHYYDVACLLDSEIVQRFIGTEEYQSHKKRRFPAKDQERALSRQDAFVLKDASIRERFEKEYQKTSALYYQGQLSMQDILERIAKDLARL